MYEKPIVRAAFAVLYIYIYYIYSNFFLGFPSGSKVDEVNKATALLLVRELLVKKL